MDRLRPSRLPVLALALALGVAALLAAAAPADAGRFSFRRAPAAVERVDQGAARATPAGLRSRIAARLRAVRPAGDGVLSRERWLNRSAARDVVEQTAIWTAIVSGSVAVGLAL